MSPLKQWNNSTIWKEYFLNVSNFFLQSVWIRIPLMLLLLPFGFTLYRSQLLVRYSQHVHLKKFHDFWVTQILLCLLVPLSLIIRCRPACNSCELSCSLPDCKRVSVAVRVGVCGRLFFEPHACGRCVWNRVSVDRVCHWYVCQWLQCLSLSLL
jgi:hypothetical protein